MRFIEDNYVNLGFRGKKLQAALSKNKEYRRLLSERRSKLSTKFKITKSEREKYVLSTEMDFEILQQCKNLEKLKLKEEDGILVKHFKSQLEYDWRKPLLKTLKKLSKKYRKNPGFKFEFF